MKFLGCVKTRVWLRGVEVSVIGSRRFAVKKLKPNHLGLGLDVFFWVILKNSSRYRVSNFWFGVIGSRSKKIRLQWSKFFCDSVSHFWFWGGAGCDWGINFWFFWDFDVIASQWSKYFGDWVSNFSAWSVPWISKVWNPITISTKSVKPNRH